MESEVNYRQVIDDLLWRINSINNSTWTLQNSWTDGIFVLDTEEDYINLKFSVRFYYKPKYIDEVLIDYKWETNQNNYPNMELEKFVNLWYKSVFENIFDYLLLFKTNPERHLYSYQDIYLKKYKEYGIIDKALKENNNGK